MDRTRAARGARRAEDRVTAAAIVDAAMALLDREGPDAITMRRVAAEVGVAPRAMYWHVGDRDALLSAMAERWTARFELEVDTTAGWKEQLRELLDAVRRPLIDHPYLLDLLDEELQATILRQVGSRIVDILGAAEGSGAAHEARRAELTQWLLFHLVGGIKTEIAFNRYRSSWPEPAPIPRPEADAFFGYTTRLVLDAIERELVNYRGR